MYILSLFHLTHRHTHLYQQSNQVILKNYGAQPTYTVDPSAGLTVVAGESCGVESVAPGGDGSAAAALAFAGGLLAGSPLLAGAAALCATLPHAFAQQSCTNEVEVEIITTPTAKPPEGTNTCDGAKLDLPNTDCIVDGVVAVLGQAGEYEKKSCYYSCMTIVF